MKSAGLKLGQHPQVRLVSLGTHPKCQAIKGSPNSENGRRLIDYLLSRETEAKLAVSCAQMPLHKGVNTPDNMPSLDDILPMKIDYDKTAQKLEAIQIYLKEWVEGK